MLFLLFLALPPGEGWLDAAKTGNCEHLSKMFKPELLEEKDRYGRTALFFAVEGGHTDCVKFLLEKGASVEVREQFYGTPLMGAALGGENSGDMVVLLLKNGVSLSQNDLMSLAQDDEVELIKRVLPLLDQDLSSLFAHAAGMGKKELLETCLPHLKSPEQLDDAILNAHFEGHADIVSILEKAGAKKAEVPALNDAHQVLFATYQHERGWSLNFFQKEGKAFYAIADNDPEVVRALNDTVFKPVNGQDMSLTFNPESEPASLLIKFGEREFNLVKQETKEEAKSTEEVIPTLKNAGYEVKSPQNWPTFRGIGAAGIADGQNPPTQWGGPQDQSIAWKVAIPGLGHSSPVVWKDTVFVTSAKPVEKDAELKIGLYGSVESVGDTGEQVWHLYALNAEDGSIQWHKEVVQGKAKNDRHPKSSHANSTPAVNEKFVVTLWGSEGLMCHNHEGKLLWKKDLGLLEGPFFYDTKVQWGHGSSPVLFEDQIILQIDEGEHSYLASIAQADGSVSWKVPRDEIPSWSSPTLVGNAPNQEIITNGTKAIRSYSPKDGSLLWSLAGNSEIAVPTPFQHGDYVVVTNGYRPVQPIFAIRLGQKGDISLKEGETKNEAIAWSHNRGGPYLPTPVAYKDHLYIADNRGVFSCYDMESGERLYRERLGAGVAVTASLLAADDKIYVFSEFGDTFIIQAGKSYQLLAKNSLDAEVLATPAISNGSLYVRAHHHLYAIRSNP